MIQCLESAYGTYLNRDIMCKCLVPKSSSKLIVIDASYHRFLVNTSGSGKTRLLFEGLCQHWGMYFTSVVDSSGLGSTDLVTMFSRRFRGLTGASYLPDIQSPSFQMVLERHRIAAKRTFGEILLARLLVFRLFVTIVHETGSCDDQKRRWLLLQLRTVQLFEQNDIFETIGEHLENVTDAFLDDTITTSLGDVQRLCGIHSGLFFAFDETNHAITQYTSYFRDEGGNYPIFKEMLRYWKGYAESSCGTFVVAGTDIPKHLFDYESGEWDYLRWLSDTGAFDDKESHQRYIEPFFPPAYRDSESGKALIRRMWQWLRGRSALVPIWCIFIDFDLVIRHRYTAAFLTILLSTEFRHPHSQLDDFVEMFTTYKPTDGENYSGVEFLGWRSSLSYKPMDTSTLDVGMHIPRILCSDQIYIVI